MYTLFNIIISSIFARLIGVIIGMVIMGISAAGAISKVAEDSYKYGFDKGKKEGALHDGTTGATSSQI